MTKFKKTAAVIYSLFIVAIIVMGCIGWLLCVVRMAKCNWAPIGKAEVVYTIGTFTGTGVIIGWIYIKDY